MPALLGWTNEEHVHGPRHLPRTWEIGKASDILAVKQYEKIPWVVYIEYYRKGKGVDGIRLEQLGLLGGCFEHRNILSGFHKIKGFSIRLDNIIIYVALSRSAVCVQLLWLFTFRLFIVTLNTCFGLIGHPQVYSLCAWGNCYSFFL
jgi:hypothetical protein